MELLGVQLTLLGIWRSLDWLLGFFAAERWELLSVLAVVFDPFLFRAEAHVIRRYTLAAGAVHNGRLLAALDFRCKLRFHVAQTSKLTRQLRVFDLSLILLLVARVQFLFEQLPLVLFALVVVVGQLVSFIVAALVTERKVDLNALTMYGCVVVRHLGLISEGEVLAAGLSARKVSGSVVLAKISAVLVDLVLDGASDLVPFLLTHLLAHVTLVVSVTVMFVQCIVVVELLVVTMRA